MDNDASGVVSMAEIGGWDCVLVNYMSAVMGAAASGGADVRLILVTSP